MKSLKKYFIGIAVFILLGNFNELKAQTETIQYAICGNCDGNSPTMGQPISYTVDQVSSDFGMRVAPGGTNFHRGIDYVPPTNASVLAVRGGTIISIIGTGLKSITVQHQDGSRYAYLHIFDGNVAGNYSRSGAFVLHRIPSSPEFAILNLASGIGYCHLQVDVNKVINYNGRQFTLTRDVDQGEAIAPVGTSIGFPYHLHISEIEAGDVGRQDMHNSRTHSIDPWTSIISTPTTLVPRLRTRKPQNYSGNRSDHNRGVDAWGEIELVYPDKSKGKRDNPLGRNILQVEVALENAARGDRDDRNSNVVMDENLIQVQMKKTHESDWKYIDGLKYQSYIRINPDGTETIYPDRINKNYGSLDSIGTGIVPFAYRTVGDNIVTEPNTFQGGFNPWDYYMFPDFYHRIIKNHTPAETANAKLSDTPENAKYNDGNYKIRSRVENIYGGEFLSNEIEFKIDNFLPFITKFQMKRGGSAPASVLFYELVRTQTDDEDNVYDNGYVSVKRSKYEANFISNSKYFIEINTSEPMNEMNYKVKKQPGGLITPVYSLIATDDTKMKWGAELTNLLFITVEDILEFEVTGKDLAGNKIINIAEMTSIADNYNQTGIKVNIPTRKNNTRADISDCNNYVQRSRLDRFKVYMSGCQRSSSQEICDAMQLIEVTKQLNGCTTVGLNLNNFVQGIDVIWTDENDNVISNNQDITVSEVGRYCYKLLGEFGDDCCSKEGCIFVEEEDFEDKNIVITPTIYPGCGSLGNERGYVSLSLQHAPPGITYSWSHNPNLNVPWTRVEPGVHSVTVTGATGCKRSLNFTVENTEDAVEIYDDVIPSDCGQNNGEIHILTHLYDEESEDIGIHWSGGSVEKSLYGLSPGQYCATVTPAYTNCAIIKCYTVPERSIEITPSVTPNTECNGQMPNGRIELTVVNGMEPYTAQWADGQTGLIRENLRVGSYLVTVTDANNCTAQQMINIPGTENLTFTGDVTQNCDTKLYTIRLYNFPNNFLYIVSLYKWVDGAKVFQSYYAASNGYQIVGLSSGKYSLETTEFPCKSGSIEVDLPEPLTIIDLQTVENLGCVPGQEDGEISIHLEGGMRPLTITVGPQSQEVEGDYATFTNLNGGLNFITFTNPSGCLTVEPFLMNFQMMIINETITEPYGPYYSPPPSNGSIQLNISGGSTQYEFEWKRSGTFFSSEKDIFNLVSGYYTVKVIDKITGCEIIKTYNLSANICKRKLSTFITILGCSPGQNQNYSNCITGCPKNIQFQISSVKNYNDLDFKLPVSVTVTHKSGYTETKTYNALTPTGIVVSIFTELPVELDPYTVEIKDACGNTHTQELYTCAKCLPVRQDHGYFHIEDNPGIIRFVLRHPCKYRSSWFTQDSEIEITKKDLNSYQEYEITWIDGTTKTVINNDGSKTKIKKGKKEFNFNKSDFDGGVKTVTVERNDGCTRNFKFRLGDKKDIAGIGIQTLKIDGTNAVSNKLCSECNYSEFIINDNLYKYTYDCNELSDINNPRTLFHYIPNISFGSNPCIGGTLTRHFASSIGVIENNDEITLPEYLYYNTSWQPRSPEELDQELPGEGNSGFSPVYNIDAGGCIYKKEYMFPNSDINHNLYVNWFRLRSWDYLNNPAKQGCGEIINVTQRGFIIEINLDPGSHGQKLVIRRNGIIVQEYNFPHHYYQIKFEFNSESYFDGVYTIQLVNYDSQCEDPVVYVGENNCPTKFMIYPNPVDISGSLRIRTSSPISYTTIAKIYDSNNNLIDELEVIIPEGEDIGTEIIPLSELTDVGGQFSLIVTIPGCDEFKKIFNVIGGIIQDVPGDLGCSISILDISYDSIKNNYPYFFGKPNVDSLYSETFTFDTLSGYFNEFTRHEIIWDKIKHVRYDSTKTVYYFGTDGTLRSFVTSIDTNGVSNTTWFYDIVFISCGPLNQQGIWTLIGYKVSEQKYYMYEFDKVNLTALPLIIPNDNRGQNYTTVWNFGPEEYATKIISGQYEIIKFTSAAYPPFEVSLSRPFKVKTVTKWNSNQWLLSGDLNGTMVIAGDTIVSEEWTKSVFIWYDWQGTVIKYKVIESEEDRIITHVATDGYQHIFFAGMEIDTIFHENPDSIVIETCLFGDTITVEGVPVSFKYGNDLSTTVIDTKNGDNNGHIRFYPNPFHHGIHVQYDAKKDETVLLTFFSTLGSVVFQKEWKVTSGLNEIYLKDFEQVSGGLYTVLVKTSDEDKVYRIIKIE